VQQLIAYMAVIVSLCISFVFIFIVLQLSFPDFTFRYSNLHPCSGLIYFFLSLSLEESNQRIVRSKAIFSCSFLTVKTTDKKCPHCACLQLRIFYRYRW
jgi:hypothetical protein